MIEEINKIKTIYVLSSQASQMKEIKEKIRELGHTETGELNFGGSPYWTQKSGSNRFRDMSVKFKTPYRHRPNVLLSVIHVDMLYTKNSRHQCTVWQRDNQGFIARCGTWADSYYYGLKVSWISVADFTY